MRRLASLVLLFLALVGTFVGVTPVRASTTIIVNITDDELNTDGDCSLREAIRAANLDTEVDTCPAGSGTYTIIIPSGVYTLTIPGTGEDTSLQDDLDITASVTISAVGSTSPVIVGKTPHRVFHTL